MRIREFPGSCSGVVITEFDISVSCKEIKEELRTLINKLRLAPYLLIMINEDQEKILDKALREVGFEVFDSRFNYRENCILYINNPSKINDFLSRSSST